MQHPRFTTGFIGCTDDLHRLKDDEIAWWQAQPADVRSMATYALVRAHHMATEGIDLDEQPLDRTVGGIQHR